MKFAMADGRMTSYEPNCSLNLRIQQKYNIKGDNIHDFRKFLQQNADQIIKDFANNTGECKLCPACGMALKYKPIIDNKSSVSTMLRRGPTKWDNGAIQFL